MAQEQRTKETSNAQAVESAGVESLIDRLRDQGIAQGRSQAEALVTAAQQQAADIVAAAKREAETIQVRAKEEAGKLKAGGEDAVRLAMRDTILSLESGIVDIFQNRLRHLVKGTLRDPDFLERLILEVAGKAAPAPTGEPVQLLLPAEIVSLEDLQRKSEDLKPGTLMHFVMSLGEGMLREGVSFGVADDIPAGVRVKLVDADMHVDLTDSAVSQFLLRHMVPRFRALLHGAVVADTSPAKPPKSPRSRVTR
jgi:V/A-type H+/Na+-transporting ATPase subunit E